MAEWQVVYYSTAGGDQPVLDYLMAQDRGQRAHIAHHIDMLAALGIELGFPYTSHVRGALWELRIRGRTQHRVLYFAAQGRRLILLHAFSKSGQKLPEREIRIAETRLQEMRERLGGEDS